MTRGAYRALATHEVKSLPEYGMKSGKRETEPRAPAWAASPLYATPFARAKCTLLGSGLAVFLVNDCFFVKPALEQLCSNFRNHLPAPTEIDVHFPVVVSDRFS